LDTALNTIKINSKNANLVIDLQKLNNEKIFDLNYDVLINSSKSILDNLNFLDGFKVLVYNDDYIFNENGVWYAYIFTERQFIKEYTKLTRDYLLRN
jgi:hypothetical protein